MKPFGNFLFQFVSVFLIGMPCAQALSAEDEGWKWTGHTKAYALSGEHVVVGPSGGSSQHSLLLAGRLIGIGSVMSSARVEVAYELSLQWAKPESVLGLTGGSRYRFIDIELEPESLNTGELHGAQNLDRLLWIYEGLADWEWRIGRQALSFGSGRSVNPTDIYFLFPLSSLDQEYRAGVDSIRGRRALGEMGELDLGVVFGEDGNARNSSIFVSYRALFRDWDWAAIVNHFKMNTLVGVDFQGDIFGQGFWFEGAHTSMRSDDKSFEEGSYSRYVVGMDYKWRSDSSFFVEYHYNGAGEAEKDNYSSLVSRLAYSEGAIFLLGKDYITPGVNFELTPLLVYSGTILWNIDDSSVYANHRFSYSIADETSLDLMFLSGDGTEGSEFSSYPSFVFASLRSYF